MEGRAVRLKLEAGEWLKLCFFIWIVVACINAALIVYHFQPVQSSQLIIWASLWPLWWVTLMGAFVFLIADHFVHPKTRLFLRKGPRLPSHRKNVEEGLKESGPGRDG